MRRKPASILGFGALGVVLLGFAAHDLWRVLWHDEAWRLVRGGLVAALAGGLLGMALERAGQSLQALIVCGSTALCAAVGVAAQWASGVDVVTALESRVLRAKRLDQAQRELDLLAVRPIDLRPRPEVIRSLRDAGIEAWPPPTVMTLGNAVDAGLLPLHPLSGMRNAWTAHCNEGDQAMTPVARTDRLGFNNADAVYAIPGERIVLLGDSYVWGSCVQQEQTIAGHLSRNGFAAISLGIGGNGPLSSLATLREFGAAIGPGTVVWFYTEGNDVDDLRTYELRSAAFRRYGDPGYRQDLARRQDEVDAAWRQIFADATATQVTGRALHQRGNPIHAAAPAPSPDQIDAFARLLGAEGVHGLGDDDMQRLTVAIIRAGRDEARRLGARFLVVPIRAAPVYRSTYREKHLPAVLAGLAQAGIEILDPDPVIRASGDPDQFFPTTHENPHYNSRGYAMLADLVRGALRKAGGIQVLSATFGRSCLGAAVKLPQVNNVRIGNLSRLLAAHCNGERRCELPFAQQAFIGDPAPGCAQDLEAEWRCDDRSTTQRFYVPPGQVTGETTIRLACP